MYKKFLAPIFLASAIIFSLSANAQGGKSKTKAKNTTTAATTAQSTEIKWLSFEEAEKLSDQNPRPFLIDFYTDWCGWCKVMDKKTYTNPSVIAHINKNYYPVKFNAESKDPVSFNGRRYNFKPDNRAHEIAIEMMTGRMSYPTTVVLNAEKTGVSPIPGYLEPAQMETILKYLEEGIQQNISWEDWQKTFTPSW